MNPAAEEISFASRRSKIFGPSIVYTSAIREAAIGLGRASAQVMIPPVEVPAIRSTIVAIGRPVRFSISASTSAGISPRIPPPSIASAFTRARLPRPATGVRKYARFERRGASEVVALAELAAEAAQRGELLGRLDPLGDERQPEPVGKRDHARDERLAVAHRGDERA